MIEQLHSFFEASDIKTDADSLANYGRDWTKHFTPAPSAIVFPKSTEQVQRLVLWANENKISLVPSGGRTGLSAGAFATNKEVVVSFEKMNRIHGYNEMDETITVDAGVVTEDLQNYAKEKNRYFPVDFASRGSSQIGGNIATNAGGIKVIRYGLIREWVSSITVVTGAGEILKLNNSLVKNATGYDLRHLFIGSEGTLGFITEACIRVTRPPKPLTVFLFAIPELSAVMNIYKAYKTEFPLVAYEMFTELAMQQVVSQGHVPRPFESVTPYYVLLELETDTEETIEKSMTVFENCMEKGWIEDGTISQSAEQAKNLWRLREDISEATSVRSPYKNDVSVQISKVPEFLEKMTAVIQKEHPDFEVVWFGHVGDGNLHINILKPDNLDSSEFVSRCKTVDKVMFEMIQKLGGSISAEHGVGLTKKPYLHHTRSTAEIEIMKNIKKVFDPNGIMNPGKVIDL